MKIILFNVNDSAAYIAPPLDSAVLLTKLVLLIVPLYAYQYIAPPLDCAVLLVKLQLFSVPFDPSQYTAPPFPVPMLLVKLRPFTVPLAELVSHWIAPPQYFSAVLFMKLELFIVPLEPYQ